jgi:nucleosome assembly protein 1-like 1
MRCNPEGANEKDNEVLKHLKRIELEITAENNDFTLVFHFEENEFFTNTELRKKFFFADKATIVDEDEDEDFPTKSEATEINWKEGKNITKKVVQKVFQS